MTLLQIMLFPLPGNPSRKQHDKPSFLPKRNLPSMFYQDQICLISCHSKEMEQVDQIDLLLRLRFGLAVPRKKSLTSGLECLVLSNKIFKETKCTVDQVTMLK